RHKRSKRDWSSDVCSSDLFMVSGDEHGVLQTRGRWSHSVDVSRKVQMVKLCNEWNMNRIWPKVYMRRESEGLLGVYGELAADFQIGRASCRERGEVWEDAG